MQCIACANPSNTLIQRIQILTYLQRDKKSDTSDIYFQCGSIINAILDPTKGNLEPLALPNPLWMLWQPCTRYLGSNLACHTTVLSGWWDDHCPTIGFIFTIVTPYILYRMVMAYLQSLSNDPWVQAALARDVHMILIIPECKRLWPRDVGMILMAPKNRRIKIFNVCVS